MVWKCDFLTKKFKKVVILKGKTVKTSGFIWSESKTFEGRSSKHLKEKTVRSSSFILYESTTLVVVSIK